MVTGDDNTTPSNVKDKGEDNINGGLNGTKEGRVVVVGYQILIPRIMELIVIQGYVIRRG